MLWATCPGVDPSQAASHPQIGEVIPDYRHLDFQGMWAGRERVTALERTVVSRLLGGVSRRRILELGTGFGRLTPVLAPVADEYVGVDFDPGGLARARATLSGEERAGPSARFALANAYHLPFASASFSGVAMVRVYHHLADPAPVLAELARVLEPGDGSSSATPRPPRLGPSSST